MKTPLSGLLSLYSSRSTSSLTLGIQNIGGKNSELLLLPSHCLCCYTRKANDLIVALSLDDVLYEVCLDSGMAAVFKNF